ncbi:Histone-lysine N-methyltransferase SUVR4, partial [Mucuna pruriens]
MSHFVLSDLHLSHAGSSGCVEFPSCLMVNCGACKAQFDCEYRQKAIQRGRVLAYTSVFYISVQLHAITFGIIMAPNPRVVKAYDAMRSLGIYDKDVKSVLKKLLQLYDRKWELIEEDNYRTLIDAYFELKEDKQAEGKRKAPISYLNGERPKQKLHLVDGDDQVSSPNNSIQGLSVQDPDMPPKTFKQEVIKPSQTSIGDMEPTTSSQALQTLSSEVEMFSTLPCTAARDRKLGPEKTSAAGHCEDPIDEPSNPHIRRKNISSNRHQNELMIPRAEKPKLHLGPASTSYNALYQIVHKKDGSSACNNNNRTQKGNINIASSPFGEVKISLNCDAALGQPNFHIPDLDAVMKSMEEKYLKAYKIVEPELSMVKLLDDLCESYLKLGLNLNRKRFTLKYANSRNVACLPQKAGTEDDKNSLYFLGDLAKGSENVKISLLDETGREDLPKFNYIPCNIIYQDANVNISLARIADEGCCADCAGDCLSLSFPCACAQETGGEFAYSPQECPLERFKNDNMPEPCKGHLVRKFIKECWRKCGCDMQCGNRIVQRGLRCKLQVYLTREGKGWGVRTLEDLPKGCFVCEYAGEILTNTELYERTVQMSGNDRHTYPVTLDADWGSERVLKDEDALCLDATYNGNVASFR